MVTVASVASALFSGFTTVGALGAGQLLIASLATVAINLAAAALLGKILAPDLPSSATDTKGLQSIVNSNVAPRRVCYGEAICGGPYVAIETWGSDNDYLSMIIALTGHPIEDVVGVFVEDQYVYIAGQGGTTNTSSGSNDLSSTYYVDTGKFGTGDATNHVRIIKNLGWGYADFKYVTDETQTKCVNDRARANLIDTDFQGTSWNQPAATRDSGTGLYPFGHKLTNCSYIYLKFKFNQDVWSGFPKLKFHIKGKPLYNPALDGTNFVAEGADSAGTHDLYDPDTWEWSENWANACLDYILNTSYGLGAKISGDLIEIDWTEFIQASKDSDDVVATGYDSPNIGTTNRYTINGIFEVGSTPVNNMEALLASGAGMLIYSQGKYKLRAGKYRAPNSPNDIINEDMIVSPIAIRTHTPRSDLYNKVAGVYVEAGYDNTTTPSNNNKPVFEPSDFPIVDPVDSSGNNPYEVIDDEEIIREIDFPYCIYEFEAQRLARIQLERVRQGLTIQFEATLEVLKYSVGDTVYLEILSNSKYASNAFFNRLGLDDQVQNRPDSPFTLYYKQFKIMDMQYTENFTIGVTLLEESEELYDWNDGYANKIDYVLESELVIDDPTGTVLPPTFVVTSPYQTVEEVTSGTDINTLIRWSGAERGSTLNAIDRASIYSYRLEYGIVTDPSLTGASRVATWIHAGTFVVDDRTSVVQGPIGITNLYINGTTEYDFRIKATAYTGRSSVWVYYNADIGSDWMPTAPVGANRYYISPTNGTIMQNSTGTLTLEAREITSAGDNLLSSGTIQLYEGSTLVTTGNGYASPSDGYTGTFDSGDISGNVVITLKDGVSGTPLDTIALVDVSDGAAGATGDDAFAVNYTNNNHTVAFDSGGEIWTGSGGNFYVYEGGTLLTLNTNTQTGSYAGLTNGEYNLNITPISGDTLTEPAITGQTTTEATIAAWAGTLTTVTVYRITAYIQGATGTQVTLSVDTTLAPAFDGADGATGAAGADAFAVNYTNDSHSVPVDNLGNETWTGSGGNFYVYEGGTLLTLNTNTQTGSYAGLTDGEYNLDITPLAGDTLTEPAITGATTTTATIAAWAGNLTTATVYRITAYIQGSTGTQVTIPVDITLAPSFEGADGSAGAAGLNNATVTLYNSNTSGVTPPTLFSGTFTYTFATGVLSGGTLNGWSQDAPSLSAGDYLWASQATASSNTATDSVPTGDFNTPQVVGIGGADGSTGTDGLNVATVTLFNKNTSGVTPPSAFSGTFTYTFATGVLSGGTLNGWSQDAPSLSAGEYLWARQAYASSNTATDSVPTGDFNTAQVVGIGGSDGATGAAGADGIGIGAGVLLNRSAYGDSEGSDPGAMYIHGFSTGLTPADVSGTVYYNGSEYTVPNTAIFTSQTSFLSSYIVLDISGSTFTLDSSLPSPYGAATTAVVAVRSKHVSGSNTLTWYYDDGATNTQFTPTANHIIIGTFSTSSTSPYGNIGQATIVTPMALYSSVINAGRIETNSLSAITATIGNLETRLNTGGASSNTTPRLVLRDDASPMVIYDTDDATELFSLTNTGSGLRLAMLGDFASGTLDTSNAFSEAGIEHLRGRLGTEAPPAGSQGGQIYTTNNLTLTTPGAAQHQLTEPSPGSFESGGQTIYLAWRITDSDSGTNSSGFPYTNGSWQVKWQVNEDSGGWTDVAGTTVTITGSSGEQQVDFNEYNWWYTLDESRAHTYTVSAGVTVEFRVWYDYQSGHTNIPKLQSSSATEAIISGSVNSFETIAVSGQSNVVADSSTDTLTFVAGTNMTITTDAGTDTITFAAAGGGSQTPWTSDIDGGGFGLDNIDRLEIQSAAGTDTVTFTHDGSSLNIVSASTLDWDFTGASTYLFTGDIWIRSGNELRIRDSGDTDYASFSHDGTDFNTTFVNTSAWNVTTTEFGIYGSARIQAVGPRLWLRSTVAAADEKVWSIDGGGGGDLSIVAWTDAESSGNNAIRITRGTGTAITSITLGNYEFDTSQTVDSSVDNYILTYDNATGLISLEAATGGSQTPWTSDIDGGGFGLDNIDRLEIQAPGVATDTATFTHDGTNFNTVFANTGVWSLSGITALQLINGADVDIRDAGLLRIRDSADTSYVQIAHTGSQLQMSPTGTTVFALIGGLDFRVYDAGNTDYLDISHDGTDANITLGNTTDLNFIGATGYEFDNGISMGSTVAASVTDLTRHLAVYANTYGLGVTASSLNIIANGVRGASLTGSGGFRVWDSSNTDYIELSHNGSYPIFKNALTSGGDFQLYDFQGFTINSLAGSATYNNTYAGWYGISDDTAGAIYFGAHNDYDEGSAGPSTAYIEIAAQGPTYAFTSGYRSHIYATTELDWDDSFAITGDGSTTFLNFHRMTGTPNQSYVDVGGATETHFRILNSTGTDIADFKHDGTDLNTDFTNTTAWNVSGLTASGGFNVMDDAGIYAYDSANTQYIKLRATSTQTQILSSNGAIDLVANSGIVNVYKTGAAGYLRVWDTTVSDKIELQSGGAISYLRTNNNPLYLESGTGLVTCYKNGVSNILRIYDSTGTDHVQITESGSNAQISTNNNNIQISTGGGIVELTNGQTFRIRNSGNTANMAMDLDSTGFNMTTSASGLDFSVYLGSSTDQFNFYQNSVLQITTQNRTGTGITSPLSLRDHIGTFRDAGYNDLSTPSGRLNASFTLAAEDAGTAYIKSSATGTTITLPASSNVDFPVDCTITLYNINASGNITVNCSTNSADLYWLDGSTITGGGSPYTSRVIGPGGAATIHRWDTNSWSITGGGIS